MFKKIIFALTLGVIATLYFAQNDQWVHDALSSKLKHSLQAAWNCSLDFEVDSVNIFVPSVTLKNVCAKPRNIISIEQSVQGPWHWKAEQLTLSSSWITFFLSSMVGLHIQVDTADGHTHAQGNYIPLFHDHIMAMMNGTASEIPLYVRSLSFLTSTVHIHHSGAQADVQLQWSSESKSIDGLLKTKAFVHTGTVHVADKKLFENLQGDVNLNFTYTVSGLKVDCLLDCTADLQANGLATLPCSVSGSWHTDQGNFAIKAIDKSLIINPLKIVHAANGLIIDAQATMPCSKIAGLVDDALANKIKGDCQLSVHSEYGAEHQKFEGECILNNIVYDTFSLGDQARISFNYSSMTLNGLMSWDYKPIGTIQGSWLWDTAKNEGSINIHNKDRISIPGFSKWFIDEQKISLTATRDEHNSINALYNIIARNELTDDQIKAQGKIGWHDNLLLSGGSLNRSTYECALAFAPAIALKKLTYTNNQGIKLLDINELKNEAGQFQGTVDIGLLRYFGQQLLAHDIQGQGHFGLKGHIKDAQMKLDVQLRDGLIRLPQTYNFINACDAHIVCDWAQKNMSINDLHIGLHRGSINSTRTIVQLNDTYNVHYAYAPFVFESCLFNIKKDLFALFSGTLAISKKDDQLAHAKGSFVVERSYVKENLYSASFQKNIAGLTYLMVDADKQNMSCDISIETKEPIRVDTAFLEAQAKLALHIANTVRDPKLSGSIELISGNLAFPYKPLLITKGSIYFMPDQLFDPLIELAAKNKIKNYTIGLQVTGSLLNHHIALEASPPLTDEQIIALLLVGSKEQSLNIVMPALLMHNLKSLLFDSEQSPLKLNSFFKSWMKPFKNINLVPSFGDQTGRGGLRGAIEIEISDRLRAMAQRNFSLSEDTRFEVEYSLSDDITLRGIRNERKDVATEVEMKWKFGR